MRTLILAATAALLTVPLAPATAAAPAGAWAPGAPPAYRRLAAGAFPGGLAYAATNDGTSMDSWLEKSADGGLTWARDALLPANVGWPRFATPDFGVVFGGTSSRVTHDGGRTWREMPQPRGTERTLPDRAMAASPDGRTIVLVATPVIACDQPPGPLTAYVTRDDGRNWHATPLGPSGYLEAVAVDRDGDIVVTAMGGSRRATGLGCSFDVTGGAFSVWTSSNAGRTFRHATPCGNEWCVGVAGLPGDRVVVAGWYGGIYASDDAGQTFRKVADLVEGDENSLFELDFAADGSAGYVATDDGIWRSVDGGATWALEPGPGYVVDTLLAGDARHALAGASGVGLTFARI